MDRAEGLYRFYVQQLEEGIKDLKGWDIHCRQQQEVFKREMDAAIQRIKESVGRRALFCIHLCLFRSDYIFRKGKPPCMHMDMSIFWKRSRSRWRFI